MLRFNIKHADDFILQHQWDGQAAAGLGESHDIAGVFADIRTNITAARRGDVTGNAIAFGHGKKFHLDGIAGQAYADDDFQLVGFAIEQADGEVVEMHELTAEFNDLFLQQLQALRDAELGDGLIIEAHQFAAGLVDGINFLLQAAAAGGVPADGDDAGYFALGVDHGRAEHLKIMDVINIEGEFARARSLFCGFADADGVSCSNGRRRGQCHLR